MLARLVFHTPMTRQGGVNDSVNGIRVLTSVWWHCSDAFETARSPWRLQSIWQRKRRRNWPFCLSAVETAKMRYRRDKRGSVLVYNPCFRLAASFCPRSISRFEACYSAAIPQSVGYVLAHLSTSMVRDEHNNDLVRT